MVRWGEGGVVLGGHGCVLSGREVEEVGFSRRDQGSLVTSDLERLGDAGALLEMGKLCPAGRRSHRHLSCRELGSACSEASETLDWETPSCGGMRRDHPVRVKSGAGVSSGGRERGRRQSPFSNFGV